MSLSTTLTVTTKWTGSGRSITKTESRTYTGDGSGSIDATCTGSTTTELDATIDVSELKAFMVVSDQAATLKANDPDTPDWTVTLEADVPYIWYEDSLHANLATADVTGFFVTVSGATDASVQIEWLSDVTPA